MNMSKSQFSGLLSRIKTTGAKLDGMISEGIAYCAYHHATHSNKEPWTRLEAACLEGAKFALPLIRAAKTKTEEARKEGATVEGIVDTAKTELEDRREKAQEKAKEKAVTAKAEKAEKAKADALVKGEITEPGAYYAMVCKSEAGHASNLVLTVEEYQAALAVVEAMRKPAPAVADQAA